MYQSINHHQSIALKPLAPVIYTGGGLKSLPGMCSHSRTLAATKLAVLYLAQHTPPPPKNPWPPPGTYISLLLFYIPACGCDGICTDGTAPGFSVLVAFAPEVAPSLLGE